MIRVNVGAEKDITGSDTNNKVQISTNSQDAANALKEVVIGKSCSLYRSEKDDQSHVLPGISRKRKLSEKASSRLEGSNVNAAQPHHSNKNFEVPLPPKPGKNAVSRPISVTPSMPSLLKTLLEHSSVLFAPKFRFEVSDEAALFNFITLKRHNFDLEAVTNSKSTPSITGYGSEFKSPALLENLLKRHPRWEIFKDRLENGAPFPLTSLPEDQRIDDLEAARERGNHKSAERHKIFLADAFKKEISKGWNLILPEEKAHEIPNLEIAPLGVADQLGVSASGDFIKKLRVTHDLSFPGAFSGESVNSRTQRDELEPCMFGHALLRVIHTIVALRQKHPTRKIWLRKEDFKSAYRRLHLRGSAAVKSAIRIELERKFYLLLSLRLPFGGASCPSDFCLISDIITDTINDLLACPEWDLDVVRSNYVVKIPQAIPLPDHIPFAEARELSVVIPTEDDAKADCFVDDIISVAVDIGDNLKCLIAAPCTVIHAISHQANGSTKVTRQDMISDDKNEAEGAPEEVKICLGWELNS